mgnify:CR=1 FL=1
MHEAKYTGIDFINELSYTEKLNPYTFRNFYNGGGVGLGDFDKDGLLDIFFSGNLVANKLYLNKGNFKFNDILFIKIICVRVKFSQHTFYSIIH